MSYAAAIDQLNAMAPELYTRPGLQRRKFSLDEVRILLAALGDPHRRFRSVLIAGTNGKGSTAATLASILTVSGARAGLYTSPHLARVNERIRIGNSEISDDLFARLYFRIHEAAQQLVQQGRLPQHPSFFEILTAIAFLYFAGEKVDLAVLEVGMGGRLDATNVVDPLLSIITDISLDHTEWLGPTIAAIAREKAGILRPGGRMIKLPQCAEAEDVFSEIAKELGVRSINASAFMPSQIKQGNQDKELGAPGTGYSRIDLHPWGAPGPSHLGTWECQGAPDQGSPRIGLHPGGGGPSHLGTWECQGAPDKGSPRIGLHPRGAPGPSHLGTWECRTPTDSQIDSKAAPYTVNVLDSSIEIASPLAGVHQRRNIALAIAAAVELACEFDFHITPHQIADGIRTTQWPGRLERISSRGVEWILDVAHNPAGAWAVSSSLTSLPSEERPRLLVFSCLRDKPINEMAQILFPLFEQVVLAPIHSARAASMEDLVAAAQLTGKPFFVAESVAAALQLARKNTSSGPIIVCGSVYLVGEARSLLLAEEVIA
jgi:dihydrofolate synthase/folylpolyglutamate synthase